MSSFFRHAGLSVVVFLNLAGALCAERPGSFEVIGPGGGGAMFNPTVSPLDIKTVLISCDMTGGYITHDGGKSWRMFNLRGTIRFFVFDPSDPLTIYAQVNGLWRSTDGGETWQLLYPKPSSMRGVRMNSDHADETFVAQPDPMGTVSALAIDPTDSRVLYASGTVDAHSFLYMSRDRGETWTRKRSLPEAAQHLWLQPGSAPASRTLVASGPHFIQIEENGKTTALPSLSSAFTSVSAAFANNSRFWIYATSDDGVFVSDGGPTWRQSALPGVGAQVRAVATSPRSPETAYVSYDHLRLDGKTWSGVAVTKDFGKKWNLVWKESEAAASNVHDAWITERFGPGWGENPLMLTVADQDSNLCYGTDLGRTMLTTDGGKSWRAMYSRKLPGGGWTSTGLDVTTTYGIHFDPFNSRRQFITYTDIGLFRSEDGGASWVSSTSGVPEKWMNTTYWVEFDPKVQGRMWSVNSYTHDLPRPKMWRRGGVSAYRGGVSISDDGGKTWTTSSNGMPETAPTQILLDVNSPVNARVLYVAAFGRGVYKSRDGGKSWTLKNAGIQQSEPFAWRLTLAADGTLYLLIARRSEDGRIGDPGDGAIYRSTDGAESWRPVTLPAGTNAPSGLAVDAENPKRLYLAAWARAKGMRGEGGGIFVSDNSGLTWRPTLQQDQHIYDVTADPRQAGLLYAAGFESSVWRSIDSGEHWKRINGFNFKWAHRVIPDPNDRNKIYVTTFGGSVWHGAVNGKPDTLDIATPRLVPGQ